MIIFILQKQEVRPVGAILYNDDHGTHLSKNDTYFARIILTKVCIGRSVAVKSWTHSTIIYIKSLYIVLWEVCGQLAVCQDKSWFIMIILLSNWHTSIRTYITAFLISLYMFILTDKEKSQATLIKCNLLLM